MLSTRIFSSQSRVVVRMAPTRVLVARLGNRSTSAKPTPSPDPSFNEVDAAGSHPVYPTTEWENPLNDPSVKSAEHNKLQDRVVKQPNVTDEALDSIYSKPRQSPITRNDKSDNAMRPEGRNPKP